MKAIILAAGKGTRLNKYTNNLPKCMLEFKGKTLIQRQVDTLRACNINDIVIVKGYMPEKIQISGVKYYINKDYENTNMVETLFCAEKEMDGGILVCYADILYEKRVVKQILASKSKIGVTVDSDYWDYWTIRLKNPESDIESLIIKNNQIVEIGTPTCKKEDANFRYVGLIKFSKQGVKILKKIYHENKSKFYDKDEPWMASKSFKKAYMTCMLSAIIKSGYKIGPIIIHHGWLEFDTNEDYEKITSLDKRQNLKKLFDENA